MAWRERAYDGFVMRPDLATLRPVPWQEGTLTRLADLVWEDGWDVVASPRPTVPCAATSSRSTAVRPASNSSTRTATGRLLTQSLQRRTANDLERPGAKITSASL
jgi:hypothetical protein